MNTEKNMGNEKKGADFMHRLPNLEMPQGRTKQQAWDELVSAIHVQEKHSIKDHRKSNYLSVLSIAASILLLIGIGSASLFYFNQVSITCPAGEQLSLVLPDQSHVTINAGSEIKYNKLTWNSKRIVKLSGEAFFEVTKGKSFEVKTDHAIVSVLGTSFNVFSRMDEVTVSCFTGKVAVSNPISKHHQVMLTPGLGTRISNGKNPIQPYNFDTAQTASWRKGDFYFNNENIMQVLNEIERQFNITIEYKGNKNRNYTGYFNNKNLMEALQVVCLPMNFDFVKNEKSVEIIQK